VKTINITDPYKRHHLRYNYHNWLLGTQTTPWRQTI